MSETLLHMCCHIAMHRIGIEWVVGEEGGGGGKEERQKGDSCMISAVGAKRPTGFMRWGYNGSLPRVCNLACKDRLKSIDFPPPPCQGLMKFDPGF